MSLLLIYIRICFALYAGVFPHVDKLDADDTIQYVLNNVHGKRFGKVDSWPDENYDNVKLGKLLQEMFTRTQMKISTILN